ncbi:MAG: putative glycoside hydrolase [Gemmatimonadetes bacterium]|nr:putative glycoside hydrolase [Gemmatimonadota bacterium]
MTDTNRGGRVRTRAFHMAAALVAAVAVLATSHSEPAAFAAGAPGFAPPAHVRGIYLNAWAAGARARTSALLELAGRTEINTFVIDVKDASGYVSYASSVPLAREAGATSDLRVRDIHGLLQRLAAEGIYPIARIVVFQDPVLAEARPDWAIHIHTADGALWRDRKGLAWVNPYRPEVWEYNIGIAREAVALGFPEIQFDYVRFPDAPRSELDRLVYPGADDRTPEDVIRTFLLRAREALADLEVPVTVDVFGLTTAAIDDMGIGQRWERFIDAVDVALPMVYPSHFARGSFQIAEPNAYPYEIVFHALTRAIERSAVVPGAGQIRPWLQDFTLGPPRYGAAEVRAQIEATHDAGIHEWILWNPGSRYTAEALAPEGGYPAGVAPLIRRGGKVVSATNGAPGH